MLNPAYSLRRAGFCTLAGVESVCLEGTDVSGRFASQPKRFYGLKDKRLFEEFANWPSDSKNVLRFTQRFGPLKEKAEPGGAFRFRWQDWKDDQEGFGLLWGLLPIEPPLPATSSWGRTTQGLFNEVLRFDGAGGWSLVTDPSDKWEYVDGVLVYNTANLFRLMVLELLATPRERLKTCACPDCPHRFFVARHLKQNYCSEPCSAWGQRQWKQKWWEEHGTEWRRQQTRKGKRLGGGSHGTRKAR